MKSKRLASSFLLLALAASLTVTQPVHAGDCFSDPVYEYDWTGTVASSGAFVRSVACMDGSTVLTTLAAGSRVSITGETDGWYRVALADGTEGWVGATLLSVTQTPYTNATPTLLASSSSLSTSAASAIRSRTVGYILLQVEQHGEAWYVDPVTKARYYMKDGPTAYEMMRTFGLGMNEADYARLAAGNTTLINSLKGRIVLRVEAHGEAYYIHPDGTVYYLADGPAAYALMREHSLGITDLDLTAVTEAELELIPYADEAGGSDAGEVLGVSDDQHDDTVTVSIYQDGLMPSGFDPIALNAEWVELMNQERVERGVAPVESDQRLVDSASNWVVYVGNRDELTHVRPYGESLLGWIEGFNYDFNEYGTDEGWVSNMFGENLALGYSQNSAGSFSDALQTAMQMFMAEEPENGPHYRNVMSPDWNTTGVGFYIDTYDANYYTVYMTFHFASLAN